MACNLRVVTLADVSAAVGGFSSASACPFVRHAAFLCTLASTGVYFRSRPRFTVIAELDASQSFAVETAPTAEACPAIVPSHQHRYDRGVTIGPC